MSTPDKPGDVVARIEGHDEGVRVVIVEAPTFALITTAVLTDPDAWALRYDDGCVVLADVVWYRPVGFAQDGRALLCKLVRDGRPTQTPTSPAHGR